MAIQVAQEPTGHLLHHSGRSSKFQMAATSTRSQVLQSFATHIPQGSKVVGPEMSSVMVTQSHQSLSFISVPGCGGEWILHQLSAHIV